MAPESAAEWFVPAQEDPGASHQVFAFPQAGGGCASFAEFGQHVRGRMEVLAANLPGRQARFLEDARVKLRPLVEDLADALPKHRDGRPYVLLGYCAGALFAYEVARELQRRGEEPAEQLISVSYASPGYVRVDAELTQLPPDGFWERIVELGGVHPAVAANADAAEIFEPGLRGDYRLIADWTPSREPVAIPVTALYGADDPTMTAEMVRDWERWVSGRVTVRTIPGGHWQLETAPAALADAIAAILAGS